MTGQFIGFAFWGFIGCIFIYLGIRSFFLKEPMVFWANAQMLNLILVKRGHFLLLFCFSSIFIIQIWITFILSLKSTNDNDTKYFNYFCCYSFEQHSSLHQFLFFVQKHASLIPGVPNAHFSYGFGHWPQEGEGFAGAFAGGVYKVGVHIPEGIYEIQILKGIGGIDVKDDENAIYIYNTLRLESM